MIAIFGLLKAFEDLDYFYERGECKNPEDKIDVISLFVAIRFRAKDFTENYNNLENYYRCYFKDDDNEVVEKIFSSIDKLKNLYENEKENKSKSSLPIKTYKKIAKLLFGDENYEVKLDDLKEILKEALDQYLKENKDELNEKLYKIVIEVLNLETDSKDLIYNKLKEIKTKYKKLKEKYTDEKREILERIITGVSSFGILYSKLIILKKEKQKKPVKIVN